MSINLGRRPKKEFGPGRKPKERLNLGRNPQEMLSLGVRAMGVRKNPGLIPRLRSLRRRALSFHAHRREAGWFEGMVSAVEPKAGGIRAAIKDEVKAMGRLI